MTNDEYVEFYRGTDVLKLRPDFDQLTSEEKLAETTRINLVMCDADTHEWTSMTDAERWESQRD